jgi:hypothetical protein
MTLFTAHEWISVVRNAIGGEDRPNPPTETHSTALLSAPQVDVGSGMSRAKRFALNKDLVDLTQPLAIEWPCYIPCNIHYQDVTKNQPPPFWFHLFNSSIDAGKNIPISSLVVFFSV